jgi:spore maturation protein SpmA
MTNFRSGIPLPKSENAKPGLGSFNLMGLLINRINLNNAPEPLSVQSRSKLCSVNPLRTSAQKSFPIKILRYNQS